MDQEFKYEKLTPMLRHYVDVKNDFKDSLLLYRVGDFYEAFFTDAITISKTLQLALTGKECGHDKRAPMCGVPHHVIDTYINKLVKNGYKVALCDQVEDPKKAKGLVKRAITRVISPGTVVDLESLDKKDNNFLLSIFENKFGIGACFADISTGKLMTFEIKSDKDSSANKLINEIEKISPSEIIINSNFTNKKVLDYLDLNKETLINKIDETDSYKSLSKNVFKHLGERNFEKVKNLRISLIAISNLLDYIYRYHKNNLAHLNEIEILEISSYMQLDANTRRNLELHTNIDKKGKENSLFKLIDKADTVMGSRLLNEWLERPLIDKEKIEKRLDLVEYFYLNTDISHKISFYLDDIYDLERIIGKISYQRANARDFISLKTSLRNIPEFKKYLSKLDNKDIVSFSKNIPDVSNIYEILDKSIINDPPIVITEGGIIKEGFNDDLDKLKESSISAEKDLINYEKDEKEKTGISKLKINYNKNNGYSIEVTKANTHLVPDYYIRKQTLKNQERYTTEKLEELSNLILGSSDKINELEYKIFGEIREFILDNTKKLQYLSKLISIIDSLNSLAKLALENNYKKPKITTDNIIKIKDGRHPVIEKNLKENEFIANDTDIGEDDNLIQIITGPNMAGKSTYMRQMAIIIILAQMGSFVPCQSASISVCDKVFTRIGASDNISKGESTFMLEMNEVSNILKNSTENSFIILDEVGRGTSSDDGLSIAMSLVDYLSKKKRAKTVFATHFHELTILENKLDNVVNLKIDILEEDNNLVFLRKISKGKTDRSYGIEVAKLSGLPDELIENAKIFMDKLDEDDRVFKNSTNIVNNTIDDIYKIKVDKLKENIDSININELTPLEAINVLSKLIENIKEI
ncbi:DNA mismatch repair protein MutS [Anaerococcus hydrogenalis]|uniref:DNA mismatch repair protein MutS n=1 Tax=Anaerococcus hydrogenalis TaxID=33029 RepID=A0A2N6ULC1_9FIRM|nr:DNA mismatch repair protein MutS [Anaerococcus hydrogenalis]MDK7694547.1 DNA mismatch repair protein MutS [Anaerococcus hydrogenalis]MDK7696325.1 DNA mismatch repair protein MutS [Anaerococcus hydrogenalis]MDK7707574.1 DNA mismatch repair protein MutS [Anaerococcus hydrogenalis]PMC82587.1 DNA mismatch repair protein MutS [Anaerococcus hydrogenalis]